MSDWAKILVTGSPHSCTNAILYFEELGKIFTVTGFTQSFGSNFDPNLPLKDGRNLKYQVIQTSKNQGAISYQYSIKTIINFCSIWAFLGYKFAHGQRSSGNSLS